MRIDLFVFGSPDRAGDWQWGEVVGCPGRLEDLARLVESRVAAGGAEFLAFWDPSLGALQPEAFLAALDKGVDVVHAGLKLGLAALPFATRYVSPSWMLGLSADSNSESSSWRLHLGACVIRADVIRQLGFLRSEFQTLRGAGLELGHRYLARGAIVRYIPGLLENASVPLDAAALPVEDELRIIYFRSGRKWVRWAVARGWLSGGMGFEWIAAAGRVLRAGRPADAPALRREVARNELLLDRGDYKVTVLIPTIDRYPYLEVLLDQLRRQTIRPHEIIVIDQSPKQVRRTALADQFPDLPVRYLDQDSPGQCTSRNAGLLRGTGDYVLFIDDDDEVPDDLIELHLKNLEHFHCEVSCGVADEVGVTELPENFRFVRVSDVFPTNNTLIRKGVLHRSGLFDLAYNRGARADADLGYRVYKSGALMMLNPGIRVLHHHAPSGGLRVHKARVITYAASRQSIWKRQLVSVTEFYLALRHVGDAAARERLWLGLLGTFSCRGGRVRRLAKVLAAAFQLPHSLWKLRGNLNAARKVAAKPADIPRLPEE